MRLWLFTLRSKLELRWALLTGNTDWLLRKRFNRWARWGTGEEMEQCHLLITQKTLEKMNLSPGDRILEVGCGEGWASRLMARAVGDKSFLVGIDIADEMVRRAQAKSVGIKNLRFICGAFEHIPCRDNSFDKVLSVEAFYYVKNQDIALRELLRVTAPEGELFLLIVFHKDNSASLEGVDGLGMPLHYLSPAEYASLFTRNGWSDVQTQVLELRSQPDGKPDVHDRPLLISGKKTSPNNQARLQGRA